MMKYKDKQKKTSNISHTQRLGKKIINAKNLCFSFKYES